MGSAHARAEFVGLKPCAHITVTVGRVPCPLCPLHVYSRAFPSERCRGAKWLEGHLAQDRRVRRAPMPSQRTHVHCHLPMQSRCVWGLWYRLFGLLPSQRHARAGRRCVGHCCTRCLQPSQGALHEHCRAVCFERTWVVASLCAPERLTWRRVSASGRPPVPRQGHTCVFVPGIPGKRAPSVRPPSHVLTVLWTHAPRPTHALSPPAYLNDN